MGWEGPLTHRQFLAWAYFKKDYRNDPTMDQYYLMQIAACVDNCIPASFVKGYKPISVDSKRLKWKLRLVIPTPEKTDEDLRAEAEQVSAEYMGMFGFSDENTMHLKPGESMQIGSGTRAKEDLEKLDKFLAEREKSG